MQYGAFQEGQHSSSFSLNNDNTIVSNSKNEFSHTHLPALAIHMHSPKLTQQNLNYNIIDSSRVNDKSFFKYLL